MGMAWAAGAGGDCVHINIENAAVDEPDMRGVETRLFSGLAQCHAQDVSIAIRVSAGLEPLVMFTVV